MGLSSYLLCNSWKVSILTHIGLFRTMTPSTAVRSQGGTTKQGGSTGGRLVQSQHTSIQLITFGTSSKTTSGEKLNTERSRNAFKGSKYFGNSHCGEVPKIHWPLEQRDTGSHYMWWYCNRLLNKTWLSLFCDYLLQVFLLSFIFSFSFLFIAEKVGLV